MEVILLSEKNLILKPIYVNYHVSSELGSRGDIVVTQRCLFGM